MKTHSIVKAVAALAVLAFARPASAQGKDIVETAVAAGSFKTLATALTAADLVGTLKGKGPFTVFAPTDEAFSKIPKATLDGLLKDKPALTKVLTYHVVSGMVHAADLAKMADKEGYVTVKTVEGSELKLHLAGKTVHVGKDFATVQSADIMASNGIIHVIDKVLMPAK